MGKLGMMVTNKLTCRLVGHDLEVTKKKLQKILKNTNVSAAIQSLQQEQMGY